MRRRARRCVSILLACAGCGGASSSVRFDITSADSAVRMAEFDGASDDMGAALYLALARQELAGASARQARGDARGARSWAMRARTDAELASMLAREARVRAAAVRTFEHARSLADELH